MKNRNRICHLLSAVHEIMRIDCERLAACNQTRYNEEKRRRDLWQEQQMYLYVSNLK